MINHIAFPTHPTITKVSGRSPPVCLRSSPGSDTSRTHGQHNNTTTYQTYIVPVHQLGVTLKPSHTNIKRIKIKKKHKILYPSSCKNNINKIISNATSVTCDLICWSLWFHHHPGVSKIIVKCEQRRVINSRVKLNILIIKDWGKTGINLIKKL